MQKFPEIADYLSPEMIVDIEAESKGELFEIMLEKLLESPHVSNKNKLRNAMYAREQLMSTGIGYGIAVPHARDATVKDFVIVFARCKKGIAYESIDDKPVHLIFMIAASDKQDKEYIKLLSRIMLKMKNRELIDRILDARSNNEIYELLK